jgi:hypothetical protein
MTIRIQGLAATNLARKPFHIESVEKKIVSNTVLDAVQQVRNIALFREMICIYLTATILETGEVIFPV